MRSSFAFRRWSAPLGGLAAELDAELRPVDVRPEHSTTVHRGIWLTLPPAGIFWKDLVWLAFGASLMRRQLTEAYPDGVQIQVHALVYPVADYRPEVAAVCMAGWLGERLGAADPGITVRADRERGAYVFAWGDRVGDPFAE
ncbi:hypothetical protein F0344_03780 [Streptomyces finlayi]|uniref:Uncharacterized protein n=1 Tax=Streptomyces finlayi TaxID=67296 RepID=A0A7G7BES4_9ACTN|nr:hypothetical protein [Streptomyces finlayi]QNE73839.1 hypothetical protein F0344_03780 [Streptomyces finlayi]